MSALKLGVGGPVGSGKTALVSELCRRLGEEFEIAAVTNDIFTREDAEFLTRAAVLPEGRVVGVETGGCPHTAIRDDISMNLVAVEAMEERLPSLDLIFVESGGDNLAASFSSELVDVSIYVVDVAGGDKVPRRGGPGVVRSELLVINKIDLAPLVGADLSVMERDAAALRGEAPTLFVSVLHGDGMEAVVEWVREAVKHRTWTPATPTPGALITTSTHTSIRRAEQIGALHLILAQRGYRTVITRRYAKAPFGSVRANYPDDSGIPEVQVTNPSGGVLGGDRLELEITLEPTAAVSILTQAANKVYRGKKASQHATFHLKEGSFLEYLPHHLIPFAGSNYLQTAEFRVAEDAILLAWDAYAAGRVACGERFAFDVLRARMRIFREGFPEAVDGFELIAGGEPFGGYSYLGVVYVLAPRDLEPLAEKLHAVLNGSPHALASASAPTSHLCGARILTRDATVLYQLLNSCRTVTRTHLDLPLPARGVW
ncbi:MAG: urease accessory protein UreG [Rubrobacter sp.]|nr:urease accessory protein UreG [Rubrobacter sp.]